MKRLKSAPVQMVLQKKVGWDSLEGKSPIPHTQTYLEAATTTAVVKTVLLVSFPPNPPPILFTRTTTRFEGTPNALAANS